MKHGLNTDNAMIGWQNHGGRMIQPTFRTSRTPNLHFCAAPNPLFHSVFQFSVGGRIRLCCMQTVGQPIEWKTDIDCFVSSQ
jgi:hypothetical protein